MIFLRFLFLGTVILFPSGYALLQQFVKQSVCGIVVR